VHKDQWRENGNYVEKPPFPKPQTGLAHGIGHLVEIKTQKKRVSTPVEVEISELPRHPAPSMFPWQGLW
jgi:hypothetical protein